VIWVIGSLDVIGNVHGRIHGLKRGRGIMVSARNEAPKGAEWGGVWRGVFLFQQPFQEMFLDFRARNGKGFLYSCS